MDKASQPPIRLTSKQEVASRQNNVGNSGRPSTGTPSAKHAFGLSVGKKTTKLAYSYSDQLSVGVEIETNLLLELFK